MNLAEIYLTRGLGEDGFLVGAILGESDRFMLVACVNDSGRFTSVTLVNQDYVGSIKQNSPYVNFIADCVKREETLPAHLKPVSQQTMDKRSLADWLTVYGGHRQLFTLLIDFDHDSGNYSGVVAVRGDELKLNVLDFYTLQWDPDPFVVNLDQVILVDLTSRKNILLADYLRRKK